MCLPLSAKLKIERAQEHLDTLRSRVYAWQACDPYHLVRLADPQPQTHLYEFRIDPPMPAFGILVGDFVHPLRSALDHVAMALAEPAKNDRGVYFPIFDVDPYTITDESLRRKKVNVWKNIFNRLPRAAREAIAAMQPYSGADGFPAHAHPLWVVHELDRADKHSEITTLDPWLRLAMDAGSMRKPPYPSDILRQPEGFVYRVRSGNRIAFQPVDDDFRPPLIGEIGFGWGDDSYTALNELRTIYEYFRDHVAPILAGLLPSAAVGTDTADARMQMLVRFAR